MPPQYYEALQYAGYENFFIVADQNQQITDDHSSRQELADTLDLEPEDVIELKINYRNSRPIALFASHFYTDKASPAPDLPNKPSLETPVLYHSVNHESIYPIILREAGNDDRKLIAVVVGNNIIRNQYVDKLRNIEIYLDHVRPIISTYSSDEKKSVDINFSQGGIVVLNDKSIKGLEFDSVYIILDGFNIYNNETTSMKKRLYVMSSRAIDKLALVSTNKQSSVLKLLPDDQQVMRTNDLDESKPEQTMVVDDFDDSIPF